MLDFEIKNLPMNFVIRIGTYVRICISLRFARIFYLVIQSVTFQLPFCKSFDMKLLSVICTNSLGEWHQSWNFSGVSRR